ncbi:MAG TPA: STAS domain-containing protein [Solirubrobacterales bacterium]|nr:STAS domain-containing protein [Solirubrobacterales bacterium]
MIRLILAGELDLAFRPTFETAVADAQTDSGRLLLDLRALTLIDCANLAVVFSAAKRSRHDGSVLILLSPRGQVRRVLDLLGAPPGAAVLDPEELPSRGSQVTV